MAQARGGQGQGGEQATAGSFTPGEFEEPEGGLPTAVPPEEEAEFEEIEAPAALGVGAGPSMDQLLAAHAQLEERLLVNVSEQAMAAEAGTDAYGPENVVGVGISHRIVAGNLTEEPCVTVYVVAKKSPDQVAAAALVPD